ncbi:PREDICTED: structural maintenance of chromosomes protein 5 [Ceratosolen solmsi marchali]|uniref:Structural maintenance of chromosomes protein 5 n=1 Tax=Ceratosolen solmsi marchali TaxID=326594 RepID=A0AAJ6YWD2_9HYME|nr:PREDICTED: structural maintenance of chromosomes protein 5 [Ceratosolen solmsi marchali]
MADDDIPLGIILRISLENFVTYDSVVIKPGKNLNLIIGANGTGKSTIVSAIVLGLGGNPKVIGRATNVGDFVKAGESKATIEIDLYSGCDKCITIRRSFDINNRTTWMINNQTVTGKQVAELMKSFNIQVDNLCQFLPQDKVQEFSNLSPHELLIGTERSVGDPSLLENHLKLKELRLRQAELEKELENHTRLQTKEKQTYDSLKDSVGHINEQKLIKKKLKTLKQKKAWILYQNKREEFITAKKEKDKAQIKAKRIEEKLKPIQEELSQLIASIQKLEQDARQDNIEGREKMTKLNKLLDDIEKYEKCVDDIELQHEQAIKEEQESDKRIDQMMQQNNKIENDLQHFIDDVGTSETIQSKFDSITKTMNQQRNITNDLSMQQNLFKQQIDTIERKIIVEEKNLQAVKDIDNKRLELLQKLSSDAYKGILWLRSNKHLFSKPVHEPMLLHINLKDAKYSKYFENIIPQRDLIAFICEDKNDMNLLVKYLLDQQKLKINIVHSDPDKETCNEPRIQLHSIQKYGFEHYLVSLIDAPNTILNYLINMYRINEIPIGNDNIALNLEQIPDTFFRFFSTNNSYSVSRSKYTREKSIRQTAISSRNLLSITLDKERIQSIHEQMAMLDEKRSALSQELENLKEKYIDAHKQIERLKEARINLQNNLHKIKDLKIRINMNNTNIQNLQSNRRNIDEIHAQYKAEIQAVILKQLQFYQQYNKVLNECYKNILIKEEIKLKIKLEKNVLAIKENDSQDLIEEFTSAEKAYKLLDNELAPLKIEVKNLFELAKESTGGVSYDDPKFTPIKNAFAKLPASIEEIFEKIETTQAQIFCISNNQQDSNRVLEQFNTAKTHLETLNEIIRQKDQELTNITEQIEKIKDKWLPQLTNLVEQINNNFSDYFTRMKCAGTVSIINGENPMDFDKYGLKIKVKFRDADELQALTRTHQSGGERAVTTATYMIALQKLTTVPFRCVDEINQGMDAINERRVFELIVNITSNCNNSQYFLLTPKLLPDLKYNDSITVLTVFNGKFMAPCSQFDISEQCNNIIETIRRRQTPIK